MDQPIFLGLRTLPSHNGVLRISALIASLRLPREVVQIRNAVEH
jgi:hypothetical protein